MPRIRYGDMTPDEQDDWHDLRENDRRVRQDNEWERKVPDAERRENHPNRQVHRDRFFGDLKPGDAGYALPSIGGLLRSMGKDPDG